MEKTILGNSVTLGKAPVHVAPGGSVLIKLSGNAKDIAKLLVSLREETAYGMADIKDIENGVQADIYLGKADMGDFDGIYSADCGVQCEKTDLPEGTVMDGLSMQARNQVISLLG